MNIIENDDRKVNESKFVEHLSNRNSAYEAPTNPIRTENHHSTLKDSSYNSSIEIEHHQIESRLAANHLSKLQTQLNTLPPSNERSMNKEEINKNVIQKRRENFANLKTCFHRKRVSVTPELKVASSSFDEDKIDKNLEKSDLKMVIKTYDKRDLKQKLEEFYNQAISKVPQSPIKTVRTTSTQQEENMKSKINCFIDKIHVGYENVLEHVKQKKPRAMTAHKRKRIYKPKGKAAKSFATPMFEALKSPIHDSIYLSRKNSYERQFDRPKPKNDILIVGKNINDYIKELGSDLNKDIMQVSLLHGLKSNILVEQLIFKYFIIDLRQSIYLLSLVKFY